MKFHHHHRRSGIALIMVMVIVVVFAVLAGALALSMKVETKLARNSNWDTEMEWLGRSGIELAKAVLSKQGPAGQQYDALNQFWAGGDCDTNFPDLSLKNNQLGHGTFSVTIIDNDRKLNINLAAAAPDMVNQALILIGVDAAEAPRIVNAIADWIDRDDQTRLGGETETDYYQSLDPPYRAKNGPIDDLTELMFIKGITPAMYYGSGGVAAAPGAFKVPTAVRNFRGEPESYPIGFVDLFTTVSGRFININTASANAMQLIPDVDGALAQAIITTRGGPDGQDGGCDDEPFRSIGELSRVPGMTPPLAQMFARYFSTRSSTYEVQVDVEIDAVKRTYFAMIRRNGARVDTLYMYWR